MNLHDSNPYNKIGVPRLPETFDVDFINHIGNVYLDMSIWNLKDQNWERIEREVHADFDSKMGATNVTRHLKKLRGITN